jgi:hypothetical protein
VDKGFINKKMTPNAGVPLGVNLGWTLGWGATYASSFKIKLGSNYDMTIRILRKAHH